MVYDPRFRTEEKRYFPSDSTDRRIEWRQQDPGYDLYEPKSAACRLKTSVSYLNFSVRNDPAAPVVNSCHRIVHYRAFSLIPAIMLSLWRRNWAILAGILAGFIVLARFFDDL